MALDLERARELVEFCGENQRLVAIEVGDRRRGQLCGGVGEFCRETCHRGIFEFRKQTAHPFLDLFHRADMGKRSAAEFGGTRHQERVRRRADADHEDAGAAAHRGDGVEQLLLVADLAVGQEHHLADVICTCVAGGLIGQRRAHRRHHLSAAVGPQRVDERGGAANMLRIGRHRAREQHVHSVIEADHIEAVARLQAAERVKETSLGLLDRRAAHRTGIVDHEDHLAGQRLLFGLFDRRRRDERQHIVGIADMLAEQSDRRRFFGRRFPGQFKIAIRRHHAVGERDDAHGAVGAFDLDLMEVRFHFAKRKAGLQANRDAGRIDRRVLRRVQDLGRDAVAVGHRIGCGCAPTAAIGPKLDALHDGRGIIARADHHRHPQRELVARLRNRLLIFDLHQYRFAGANVGDRICKNVRSFLFGQRGLLSVRTGLLVDDASLLPLPDLADHDAVADHHLERVDRAARRQRIDVSRLHPVLRRVFENLRDAGADRRARYREIDVDAEPCRLGGAVAIVFQQQRTGAHVGGPGKGELLALRRPRRLKTHK